MTMEAAIIMPLYIIAIMAFISIIHLLYIQMCVQSAIDYVATSMQSNGIIYDYIYGASKDALDDTKNRMENMFEQETGIKDNDLFEKALDWSFDQILETGRDEAFETIVEMKINKHLREVNADYSCIVGGLGGMSYEDTKIISNDGDFEIIVRYEMKIPILLSRNVRFNVCQGIKARMFGGSIPVAESSEEKKENASKTSLVYITEQGEVYHLDKGCVYLTNRMVQAKLGEMEEKRNDWGGKYYLCERCGKDSVLTETDCVYYSVAGERYHSTLNCSTIVRKILEVSMEEVKDRRECTTCGDD